MVMHDHQLAVDGAKGEREVTPDRRQFRVNCELPKTSAALSPTGTISSWLNFNGPIRSPVG